jgi:hypothetical protein
MLFKTFDRKPVSAFVIGSISDTLSGRVDPRLQKRRFLAADYSFGFEAASPRSLSSIGESVLLNGTCYATSTEEESSDYGKVIFGPEFVTGGMFLLPKNAMPTHSLTLNASMSAENLYQAIYEEVGRPVAFTGIFEASSLYTMQIGKPPIGGLPIFKHRDYYFPSPHETLQNKHVFAVGVIASFSDPKWKSLMKELELVLYNNPDDKNLALSSHTHCLILNKKKEISKIVPSDVERCLHVFTDQTILKSAFLRLYTLEKIEQI